MKIKTPTLIIDEIKCRKNIEKILEKTKKNNILFRPHFKTHQSITIGNWFRDYGIRAITVSSVKMARYFALDGWNDITIAFPINILELDEINYLASKIYLNIIIVDSEPLDFLLKNVTSNLGVFLKVDVGTHRTGILPNKSEEIKEIIKKINNSKHLNFKGFLAHYGHTYQSKNVDDIKQIFLESNNVLFQLRSSFYKDAIISIGDTPSCSIMNDFTGIDEIRPGNFIFYDIMQLNIGSCVEDNIAVALAVPIVARHRERGEMVVYGGAVHLSKDFIIGKNGEKIFGYIVDVSDNSWGKIIKESYVKNISQEHGIIKTESSILFDKKIGDLLGILPVHSCLTADLNGFFLTTNGKIIYMMDKRKF